MQFFGSTDAKIKEENFILNKNNDLGPGTYDAYSKGFANAKRANTAAFSSTRKDMLFSGNDKPGPMHYNMNTNMTTKNW